MSMGGTEALEETGQKGTARKGGERKIKDTYQAPHFQKENHEFSTQGEKGTLPESLENILPWEP